MVKNENLFTNNPVQKPSIPKPQETRRKDIITHTDLQVLKNKLKENGRENILFVVTYLEKYGYRVGIFENMEVDPMGNWRSFSKTKVFRGKFTKQDLKKYLSFNIKKIRKVIMTNVVRTYTQKLFKLGKISCPFSVHDIRHYYITKRVNEDPTYFNVLKIQKQVGHKNITTTFSYINEGSNKTTRGKNEERKNQH